MLARTRPFAAALALALALVALSLAGTSRGARAGTWAHDPSLNTPVVTGPLGQCVFGMVEDGKDGAIVAVANPCSLVTTFPAHVPEQPLQLYHLRRNDGVDPTWPAGGVALPFTVTNGVAMLKDPIGGAFLAWSDTRNLATTGRDEYLLHFDKNGVPYAGWPASGLLVCAAPGAQLTPRMCTDGAGGVYLAWSDRRDSTSASNASDVYALHVKGTGVIDPTYPVGGKAIYAGATNQAVVALLPDTSFGAYVVWSDRRNGSGNAGDFYAQHLQTSATIDPAWPAGGLGVAATTQDENYDGALADGHGGYYVSFDDFLNLDVSLVHFLPNGTLDPAWPVGGPVLTTDGQLSYAMTLLPDGTGGVLALWDESPDGNGVTNYIFARHVLSTGTLDPTWGPNPRPFAPTASFAALFDLVDPLVDPAGGGLITWADSRPGAPGAYVMRVKGDLTPAPGWNSFGIPLATAPNAKAGPFAVRSGTTGAVYAWTDARDSVTADYEVFAQRLSERGRLGVDAPIVSAVTDVAADQGGHALVRWYWSSYDTLPNDAVSEYAVWRQIDGGALTAQQRAAAVPAAQVKDPAPGALRLTSDGVTDAYWEFVGSTPSRGVPGYALAVATHEDSTAAGGAFETYEVDAHLSPANEILSSPPDSGYSVDNLAPATPTGFAGVYASGTASVHWDPVIAPDLAGYRLYRGAPSTFTPSLANRIATPTTTNYTDPAGATYYYKLSAADVHGNESATVTLLPTGALTGVDDSVGVALAFARPTPDPALERTRLAYALPHAGRVRLAVYDLAGRMVRRLEDGAVAAGVHGRDWDLTDDRGARVRAGMYFARFEADGRRMERRVIVAR